MNYLVKGSEPGDVRKKPVPDPKKHNAIPPDMDYVYLEYAKEYPLQPRKLDYSPVNAWWLAECSYLAYTHPGFARMAYQLAGYEGFRFFSGKGTECMVAWNTDCVIVSFRGTELRSISAIREISIDLDAASVPFPLGGHVHRGFLRALHEIWEGDDALLAFLHALNEAKPRRPMWVTGHSLGGALATLAFSLVPWATGLYVYGTPRVGDGEFISLIGSRPVWRVENVWDPVVLLPPDIPQLGFEYVPAGQLKYLDGDGELLDTRPKLDSQAMTIKAKRTLWKQLVGFLMIFRRLKKRREAKPIDAKEVLSEIGDHVQKSADEWRVYISAVEQQTGLRIDDHMPIFYAVKLWNSIISSNNEKASS